MPRGRWTMLILFATLFGLAAVFWPRAPSRTVKARAAGPLYVQWVRSQPRLHPAWPDQAKLQFDAAYQPVLADGLALVASSRHDDVTAIDLASGAERWRFQADGPVRFAPVVWDQRVYFSADDGYLYCVDAGSGELHWKVRGGPGDRKLLGNNRLISTWPARGAPVVADGVVYFAAGIWPFMGIFIHAVDARTGQLLWTRDGDGSTFQEQPHYADAFGGVAPQGRLAVSGQRLLVPGGRSVPACYDRRTGQLLYFHLAEFSKTAGGFQVQANDRLFVNGGALFDLATGEFLGQAGDHALLVGQTLFACNAHECKAYDVSTLGGASPEPGERTGRRFFWRPWSLTPRGAFELPDSRRIEYLAHDEQRLYAAAGNRLYAFNLPLDGVKKPAWHLDIDGAIAHITASAGRLLLATRDGRLCWLTPEEAEPRHFAWQPLPLPADENWAARAQQLLQSAGQPDGYCIAWGVGSGGLVAELVRQSRLHVIVIEPDEEKVRSFRAELIAAGLYGERVAIVPGSWQTVQLPPYLATLMVAEEIDPLAAAPECLRKLFTALRPYGGTLCLPISAEQRGEFESAIANARLDRARLRTDEQQLWLTREGALTGSADWTHQHADAANTRVSRDRLVRAPLGVLWFGGPPNDGILPRHGHGPQPQVVDGRLIIEGPDKLRAIDIYTGRLLWEAPLPGVGAAFDNTFHQAGANGSGSNYISTSDGIYVIHQKHCLRLDPATGRAISRFRLPRLAGLADADWGYLNVSGPYLIGGANPPTRQARSWDSASAASKHLVVMDRYSGKVLWTTAARLGFRHNAVCIGKGRLYAIDRAASDYWDRRGDDAGKQVRLAAFDLASGKTVWERHGDVFGTFLSYSEPFDVLVESGLVSRDTLWDEAEGVRAYRGDTGQPLWREPDYAGPAMIHGDRVLLKGTACDLRTGRQIARKDPLTGQEMPWTWPRGYGCNTPIASTHLLTFRSGAAGYFDLTDDGGTGNWGGFRSGCTNNLIVAGGVLCAPDYTRTCSCSYQNQTSVAFVPMADAEMWTYYGPQRVEAPVQRVGINLGAPGNRKAADGTLWLEYPFVGGPSYRLPVAIAPEKPDWFRRHSSWVEAGDQKWVAASGARGLQGMTIRLAPPYDSVIPLPDPPERRYTVRLHFVEPDDLPAGQRIFHVALQGERVLDSLDIAREAGGPRRGLVKEIKGVKAARDLFLTFTPATPTSVPVLCGVEVRLE